MVEDISRHEGLRVLNEEGVSFQAIKTYKQSTDPHYEAKKNRVLELYDIVDGKAEPKKKANPEVVICMDEFGPLPLAPARKQWAPGRQPAPPRCQAPPASGHLQQDQGVRHLFAAST